VPPHLSGRDGGHTINLHAFAREGIVLLGHLQGVHDGKLYRAPDLKESLARIDQFEVEMLNMFLRKRAWCRAGSLPLARFRSQSPSRYGPSTLITGAP
jgi:hypothetical protein